MIENELQYRVTTDALTGLEKQLASMGDEPPENVHPILWKASKAGYKSKIDDLKEEIAEWNSKVS